MSNSHHPLYYPYLVTVAVIGLGVLSFSVFRLLLGGVTHDWIILAALTVLSGSFTVKIPGVDSKVSVADTFVFTNLVLFGPEAGVATAALDGLMGSIRGRERARRLDYALFNVGAMSLSAYLAGHSFFLLIQRGPLFLSPSVTGRQLLLPLASMAFVHFLLNSGSVAAIVALERKEPFRAVWHDSYLWTSITYFVGASGAGIVALNASSVTPAVLGVIVPILLIVYVTYRTYLTRLQENVNHLRELNRLYLNTVETLAMAIDAKDQVTHGHVRRVQVYTRGLARAMGITDENALRGIESAALLHDIGKLAIPEYILNKPAELTRAEFQKMMIHPDVGADILASINFPYPVADFVRHHHEHWDGTGYPDHLAGTQIPLGARVLAVADCYEALTCDRPYRTGYSQEKAIQIIRSRAGKQYDPEVVDRFEEILEALTEEVREIEVHESRVEGLRRISETARDSERRMTRRSRDMVAFQDISSTYREVFALYELAQTLGSTLNLHETLMIVASKIEKIVPFSTCVIYLHWASKGRLKAEHALGESAAAFKDHAMAMGENLSGRVAALNQPAINVNPGPDLAAIRDKLGMVFTNSLVYPLNFDSKCLGTISLYAAPGLTFKDDHVRIMETVSKQAAAAIYNAMRFEETQEDAFTDCLTGLPNSRYLYLYFEQELQKAIHFQYPLTLLNMDLDGFKEINDTYGHPVGDRMLVEVAKIFKSNLRGSDLVVRYAGDEFIAVMVQTAPKDAALLARRVQSTIDDFRLEVRPGKSARVGLSIGLASYPSDGDTLDVLMVKADQEMYRDKESRSRSSRRLLHEVPPASVRPLEWKNPGNP
jgi:diguanylate cyclase (GGDEF)-like protein/putative nucleotidyltransferase with HDIG domain